MGFEGFRHTPATTRASALRRIFCRGFSRRHTRKGVRQISTCAREAGLVAFCENLEKPWFFFRFRRSSRGSFFSTSVLRNHVLLHVFRKLDCEILPAPKVFEGFRHARATTRACALRPIFCKGFAKKSYVRTKDVPAYRFLVKGTSGGPVPAPLG